jgi:HEPN domain-containing protein
VSESRLARAWQLHEDGDYALAVVAAQMACELRVREVLLARLPEHASGELLAWFEKNLDNTSLHNDSTNDLWHRLTGSRVEEKLFKDYRAHVKRRNQIVHHGAEPCAEDAETSLDVVGRLLKDVEECAP